MTPDTRDRTPGTGHQGLDTPAAARYFIHDPIHHLYDVTGHTTGRPTT